MSTEPPSILQQQIIVFSASYLPVALVNIKRAIVLLVTGQAEGLDYSSTKQWEIRSATLVLQVPDHIRLLTGNPERQWKTPAVSRRELFRRDNHACQYCGSTRHLTIDHVLPRSKGGSHTWDNVVTACERCNSRKGDKLLHEIGMTLKAKPKAPIHPAIAFAEQFWKTHEADGS